MAEHSPFTAATQQIEFFEDEISGDSGWCASESLRLLNVYGNNQICWGHGNSEPESLAEAALAYSSLPANQDLISIDAHITNTDRIADSECNTELSGRLFAFPDDRQSPKALILAKLTPEQRQAFMLLATAPNAQLLGDVAAITATWQSVSIPGPGGTTTPAEAWVSDPLPDGTRWLIGPDEFNDCPGFNGVLLGQLNPTPPLVLA